MTIGYIKSHEQLMYDLFYRDYSIRTCIRYYLIYYFYNVVGVNELQSEYLYFTSRLAEAFEAYGARETLSEVAHVFRFTNIYVGDEEVLSPVDMVNMSGYTTKSAITRVTKKLVNNYHFPPMLLDKEWREMFYECLEPHMYGINLIDTTMRIFGDLDKDTIFDYMRQSIQIFRIFRYTDDVWWDYDYGDEIWADVVETILSRNIYNDTIYVDTMWGLHHRDYFLSNIAEEDFVYDLLNVLDIVRSGDIEKLIQLSRKYGVILPDVIYRYIPVLHDYSNTSKDIKWREEVSSKLGGIDEVM